MATTSLLPDQNTIVGEIFIAAPPARVFQAITDPKQTLRWWGQQGKYRITESTADLRPGGKWSSVGLGDDGTKFMVEGEYLEVDPPRLLVLTWNPSWDPQLKTVLRWELEPRSMHGLQPSGPRKEGTGTMVKIRHDGFRNSPAMAASHSQGWKHVLGWLQGFVEEGTTVDDRPALSAKE